MKLLFLLLPTVAARFDLTPINDFLKGLDDYYQHSPILENTWNNPMEGVGLQRLADKMKKDTFVIGVIGSSVAAGHDNCNYDSYERQLERTLQPIFEFYGKTVEVRNAGEGGGCGDSYRNQIWCVRQLVGDDVDVVHYSWTYFEAGDRTVNKWHETFIRWSLLLDSAPVPTIINVGEGGHGDRLYDHYKQFGYNTIFLQKGLKKQFPNYKKKWGVVGDGMHNETRYGGSGVMWRNWHPGPLSFELLSNALAKTYVEALKLSLTQKSLFHMTKMLSQADFPKPVFCDPKWCASEEPPGCVNYEQPTYGTPQIRIVTPETDDLMPYTTLYDETTKDWEYSINGLSRLIPRADRARKECQHLDHCAGYLSRSDSWTTFRLPRMTKGQIFVCCTTGKRCGDKMLDFDFVLDGHQIDHHTIKKEFGKCVQILDGFHSDMQDSSGHLYLAVRGGEEQVRISHVITL